MALSEDDPCGRCDSGVYAYAAIFNAASQAIAAGGPLPRCKAHDRICVGAYHFKAAFDGATSRQRQAILEGKAEDF